MLCALHEWQDLQFKVDSERQIFEKLFMAILFLLSEFLPEICREEATEKMFFFFIFRFDVWPGMRT